MIHTVANVLLALHGMAGARPRDRRRPPVGDAGVGRYETPGRADASGPGDARIGWIVCAGATRDVICGQVTCPQLDTATVSECLACNLLETLANERDRSMDCATSE